MEPFEIEKNVPMRGTCKYPWKEMEVGDSFVASKHEAPGMYSAAAYQGIRIAVRSIGDGKVRVWRIA